MSHDISREFDWNSLSTDEFRAIIRADFEANYPQALRYPSHRLRWHQLRDWYLRMADKGWIAPNWPSAHGGMGLSPEKLLAFIEEQERFGIARFPDQGITMIGPVLIRFGTEEQRGRFLPHILSCEHIWCQGYSEPNAGSDLASLRTEARLDGDAFVINGQKIWTTLAQDATHIFMLVRTNASAKKQSGISFLLVDMASPGITIRPIRDIAGHDELNEVFFENVRTPKANLVGALNDGWTIAKSLLGFERIFLGSPKLPEYGLQILRALARAKHISADPVFAENISQIELDVAHLSALYGKFGGMVSRGEPLGPDVSILKIFATETFQKITDLILETTGALGGLRGDIMIGDTLIDTLGAFYKSRPTTIYGGSNEIQRNIIAKQVLHLPAA